MKPVALVFVLIFAFIASGLGAGPLIGRLQSNPTPVVDVVLIAHQDDWQLFMGDLLTKRLRSGHQMDFVYLTAGDDGRDSVYWKTRERGALQSTKLAAGLSPRSTANCSSVPARGHSVTRCDLGNTKSYFLRLPDGRRNGSGFAIHRYQSLRQLRAGVINTLGAIDGSAQYHGWSDLAATVIALAGADSGKIVVHATDPSVVRNPHDHFDHRMAGLLAADMRQSKNWSIAYYLGYALASRAANRSSDEARTKTELLVAYDQEMQTANPKWGAFREHPAFYSACLQRTYSRIYSPR